jgi:uncharacterized protein YjbJ (UPF0337 family)
MSVRELGTSPVLDEVSRPARPDPEEHRMSDKTDQLKGRVKEAVGDLTDDEDLEREGKVDRAAGTIKEKAGEAVDKVKDALHRD